MTKTSIITDHADLIAYHTSRTSQAPSMYFDKLTHRVVADVSTDSRDAFQADTALQRFLSVKVSIWRAINVLREANR